MPFTQYSWWLGQECSTIFPFSSWYAKTEKEVANINRQPILKATPKLHERKIIARDKQKKIETKVWSYNQNWDRNLITDKHNTAPPIMNQSEV